MSPTDSLSSTQQQVLALIAAGSTARAAAEAVGVHRNTVANWLCLVEFRRALAYAQYEKAQTLRDQAESLAGEAHAAVRSMLADPSVPAGVRLKAALAILNRAAAPPPQFDNYIHPDDMPDFDHKNAQPAADVPPQPSPRLAPATAFAGPKPGRNDACPCGSGMKFKRCCLGKPRPAALRPAAAIADA